MEEWRNIEEYANYQVSDLGNVRSNRKVLAKILDKYGYHTVTLHNEDGPKICKVHRLVAKAFLPNYSDNLQVNHKDEVKTNNQVSNLEMCTNRYNCNYGSRRTELAKPVIQETLDGIFVREWESTRQIERELGYKHTSISSCCKGEIKDWHTGRVYPVHSAYNFRWRYKL